MSTGSQTNTRSGFFLPRIRRTVGADDVDASHETALSDRADMDFPAQLVKENAHLAYFRLEVFQSSLRLKDLKAGQRGRASQRVAAVAMAIEKGLHFGVIAEEGFKDALRGQGGGERHGAP